MKKNIIIATIVLALTGFSFVNAQNFNDALRLSETETFINARALSMGNSYTALSNDFSGTLFNPAGIALVKKLEFSGGFNYNSLKNDTRFFNTKSSNSDNNAKINQFGFVFPFPTYQGSFALALGYNRIKDFSRALKFDAFNPNNNSLIQDLTYYNDDVAYELALSYPEYDNNSNYLGDVTLINGRLNQRGTILHEGGINNWSISGAIEIQKDIFVGATFNFYSGDYKRNREYWEEDLNNVYPANIRLDPIDPATADFKSFYFNDIIKWDVSGFGAVLGLLAKLDEGINVGFSLKTPTKYSIKEIYLVDGNSLFGNNVRFYLDPPIENRYEYDISTPFEFNAGFSFNRENWVVSADAKLVDYSSMEFTDGLAEHTKENKNKEITELFRTVINFHGGIEYLIPNTAIALRGGLMYLTSPYKDDAAEFDKKYLTLGVGFIAKRNIEFNFAYARGWWKDIGDNYGSGISRTYQDLSRNNMMMSVKYYF